MDEVLALIREIWEKSPDLRLCQLILNIRYTYPIRDEDGGYDSKDEDLFHLEDKDLVERLQKAYEIPSR